MKIVVLAGGLSPERNVSLSSGTMITHALRSLGHQAALVDMYFGLEDYDGPLEAFFDRDVTDRWKQVDPKAPDLEAVKQQRKWKSPNQFGQGVLALCQMADIVFLAFHGTCGEDGRVQAAFDLLGIPYTGSDYLCSAIAMDKDLTKRLVAPYVTTAKWRALKYTADEIETIADETELPCVVKPNANGSSIGVTIAHTREEVVSALTQCLSFGAQVVIEQYIHGRELQVGILDGKALPAIEIIPKTGFYDYVNKYQAGAAEEVCPAPIPAEWEEKLRSATETVFRVLELSVYSRADFIVTEDGTPYFLEINTLPGMTPTSLVPQEAAAAGIGYGELCERIVTSSLRARKEGRA